jgi:hypothetical protein
MGGGSVVSLTPNRIMREALHSPFRQEAPTVAKYMITWRIPPDHCAAALDRKHFEHDGEDKEG